jgi:hypothetical protein
MKHPLPAHARTWIGFPVEISSAQAVKLMVSGDKIPITVKACQKDCILCSSGKQEHLGKKSVPPDEL